MPLNFTCSFQEGAGSRTGSGGNGRFAATAVLLSGRRGPEAPGISVFERGTGRLRMEAGGLFTP
jgi:hypothetical protein